MVFGCHHKEDFSNYSTFYCCKNPYPEPISSYHIASFKCSHMVFGNIMYLKQSQESSEKSLNITDLSRSTEFGKVMFCVPKFF